MEDAVKVQKLYAVPVEETVTFPDGTTKKIWLHPLKHPVEDVVCIGIYRETYDLQKAQGCDEQICKDSATLAGLSQRLYFSARVGKEPKSERFFKTTLDVIALGESIWQLSQSYFEAFEAKDDDEMGESSRVSS